MQWDFVWRKVYVGSTIAIFLAGDGGIARFYLFPSTERLWIDAHIYFQATQAWVSGANPWMVRVHGVPYAAPPPALLLNLPLLPFGESVATAFWVAANALSVGLLLRRFRRPLWWVLFLPIAEGFLGASADLTLAALVLVGVGWLAALIKPYSIPSILARRKWRAVAVASAIVVISVPILPWGQFVESRELIGGAFETHTMTVSAFGVPALMVATTIALIALGRKRGLALTTPGLLAQQPHYLVFSLDTIARSRILTWAMAIPIEHLAAVGILAYAIVLRVRLWRRGRRSGRSLP